MVTGVFLFSGKMNISEELKSNFKDEYQKGMVNLLYTNNVINHTMNKLFKRYGVAGPQFNVLRILRGQMPNAASVGLIKERMIERNSDVSRIVDRLFKKGLVERNECKEDRRQKNVKISEKGMKLLAEIDVVMNEMKSPLNNLTDIEVKTLNELLDKVRG